MTRRLLNVIFTSSAALSLLIGLAAVALGVRGLSVTDQLVWRGSGGEGTQAREWGWSVRADHGRLDGGREEYVVTFATPADAEAARSMLASIRIDRWRTYPRGAATPG